MDPRIRIRIHTKMSWICNTGFSGLNPRSRIRTKILRFRFCTIFIFISFGSGPSRAEQGEANAGGATQDIHSRGEAQGIRLLLISVADPGSGAFLIPGSGMGKKIRIRIRDEKPGTYTFPRAWKQFFGLKYNILLCASGIRDGKNTDPGSGMKEIRI
jgi:hypothetical protein